MAPVGEAVNAAEHCRYRPQTRTPRNQKHHEDLVLDRLRRRRSRTSKARTG